MGQGREANGGGTRDVGRAWMSRTTLRRSRRERERERERERARASEREREKQSECVREKQRDRERDRDRETQREKEREECLGLVCASATRQRVVLASPVTGNEFFHLHQYCKSPLLSKWVSPMGHPAGPLARALVLRSRIGSTHPPRPGLRPMPFP